MKIIAVYLHLLIMYFPQYKYMTFMYSYHNIDYIVHNVIQLTFQGC